MKMKIDLSCVSEIRALWIRNRIEETTGRLCRLRYATQARRAYLEQIKRCAHEGKVVVYEHGRDCDGVQYANSCQGYVDATPAAVDAFIDKCRQYADGPTSYSIEHPMSTHRQYESRDLVMQAHEDGHAHVIYI